MSIEFNIFRAVLIRMSYICGATAILWLLRRLIIRNNFKRLGYLIFFFKAVNILMIIGYVLLILQWKDSNGPYYVLSIPLVLINDIMSVLFFTGYIVCFLWQSYHLHYRTNAFLSSYILQYGYIWLFVLNILVFLRVDSYYLPLFREALGKLNQIFIEFIVFIVFMLLQLGTLYIRKIKMIDAPPDLQALVTEVASCFKIRIKNVRVWQLDQNINAYSTGIFRRNILLTKTLLDSADWDDLKMILGHECAHFKCHHLEKRALVGITLVYLVVILMDDYPNLNWLLYMAFLLVAFLLFQAVARRQELVADQLAGKLLGGQYKMADALNRVFGYNTIPVLLVLFMGHPDLATRIKHLRLN